MSIEVKNFFDDETATLSYVVHDKATSKAAVIDSVLNYDQYSGRTHTKSADIIIDYIKDNNLYLDWIIDTHIHADHLTGSSYIKSKLGGKTCIGSKILEVIKYWVPIFNTGNDTDLHGNQFDKMWNDGDKFFLGETEVTVMHTPGHTPACCSYLMDNKLFVGDTIFMPDVGTARTDFPGGSAATLYESIQKIYELPDNTEIYLCHDYPPENSRPVTYKTTIGEEKEKNILLNKTTDKSRYVEIRNKKDEGKPVPKLLLPSIQVNLRGGTFGHEDSNQIKYIRIPIDVI